MVKQVLCEHEGLGSKPQDAFKHTPVTPMLLWQGDGRRAGESQKLTHRYKQDVCDAEVPAAGLDNEFRPEVPSDDNCMEF